MTRRLSFISGFALAALFALTGALHAADQPPLISFVYPAGAQQGKTIETSVTGLRLRDATGVRVSGSGVTGTILVASQPEEQKTTPARRPPPARKPEEEAETIRISVTVDADAEPGMRELRLIGPGGVSNRYRFMVGQLPESNEVEPNSTLAAAQRVDAIPFTVNGQLFGADADVYRFRAKAGQTIVCEALGRRLLPFIPDAVPGWMQAALTLYDADGREIEYVDDFRFKPDPVLIHRVEKDGDYLIEIKDALFRGREDFVYRLSVGELPFITDIYPLGARRNSAATVALAGVNLDRQSVEVKLPDERAVMPIGLKCKGLVSNSLPFESGNFDEANEAEANDAPDKANRIAPGTTVNGRIDKPGDVDCFVFAAEAKQTLVIDVRARRLDSPLDSTVVVLDAKGKEIARSDDWTDEAAQTVTHHADSHLVQTFAEAGDYVVCLRDMQGKGGAEYAYRLSIAPPKQDFALRVMPDNPRIAPGDTVVLTGDVVRMDGFEGEIRFALDGLPKGYSARGAVIPAKENEVRFTVTAPPEAPPGTVTPKLTGSAEIDGQTVTRVASPAEEIQQAFSYMHRVPTNEMLMAVAPFVGFTLSTDLAEDKVIEIPQSGEAEVVLKAVRDPNAKGQIRIAGDRLPQGLTVSSASIADDKGEATVTLRSTGRLPVGFAQNIILTGTLKVGQETITRYAPAIPIRIKPWSPPGLADAEGLESLSGWAVDISWSRAGTIAGKTEKDRGKVMEIACEGEPDRKLALVLLTRMDLSKATKIEMDVDNPGDKPILVSVAFGAAPAWTMHETPSAEVAPGKGPVRLSFALDRTDFKSQGSEWKHALPMPAGGRIDKTMLIVEGLGENASVRFDGIRFGGGEFDGK